VANDIREAGVLKWLIGSWAEPIHRFHGFDSMLITVSLVPAVQPHSRRNVLGDPFLRAFVPRIIYSGKGYPTASQDFGNSLWAYYDPSIRGQSPVYIAPSMPGDLFEAGGVVYVALGALIWGIVLGLLDGWKRYLASFAGAALTAFLATSCAMSVERDFDHVVAATCQMVLVVGLSTTVIAIAERRSGHSLPEPRGWSGKLTGRSSIGIGEKTS
jgi:hypothetical protein